MFPQPGQGLGDVFPDAEPVPDGIEFVAVGVRQFERGVLGRQLVEHGAMQGIRVLPRQLALADLGQFFEHAPAPGERECAVVHLDAPLLGQVADRRPRGRLPIEDAAADVERQGLDAIDHAVFSAGVT